MRADEEIGKGRRLRAAATAIRRKDFSRQVRGFPRKRRASEVVLRQRTFDVLNRLEPHGRFREDDLVK
jgi:hypothetical protein